RVDHDLELVATGAIALAGRAMSSGNGHSSLPNTITLVSLAPRRMSRSTGRTRPTCTNRSPPRSAARSPTARASACPPAKDLAAVLGVGLPRHPGCRLDELIEITEDCR